MKFSSSSVIALCCALTAFPVALNAPTAESEILVEAVSSESVNPVVSSSEPDVVSVDSLQTSELEKENFYRPTSSLFDSSDDFQYMIDDLVDRFRASVEESDKQLEQGEESDDEEYSSDDDSTASEAGSDDDYRAFEIFSELSNPFENNYFRSFDSISSTPERKEETADSEVDASEKRESHFDTEHLLIQ